jgi:hypothetical protein
MPVTKKDIEALKILGSKSKYNKKKLKKTIELYKDRRIERFDTTKIIIDGLAFRGPSKQQKAKDKLNFYEKEYIPRRETLANPLPSGL